MVMPDVWAKVSKAAVKMARELPMLLPRAIAVLAAVCTIL
jgi:hypothetical protein